MKKQSIIILLSICLIFIASSSFNKKEIKVDKSKIGTMEDIDGNEYETITIGNQVWMLENLNVTKFRNGDLIPNVSQNEVWEQMKTGAYCDYKDNLKNSQKYGKLYNWFAVNDERKIAPEGWHVPTEKDWNILIEYLGGENSAGGKLKEEGSEHWVSPNSEANNSSGFTALPGGIRYVTGSYYNIGTGGYWWCSSDTDAVFGITYHLYYFFGNIYKYEQHKELGVSVRCIKD